MTRKNIKHAIRTLGQVLQVRSWDLERERARFSDASRAFDRCEQTQQGIEAEIRSLDELARTRLASGQPIDVSLLQHAKVHGESRRQHLDTAIRESHDAHQQREAARDSLSAVFSESRALDNRRSEMQAEWNRLAAKRAYREQDEHHAARPSATHPLKGTDGQQT